MELSSVPLATDYSIQHYLLNIDSKNRNGYFITQLKPCLAIHIQRLVMFNLPGVVVLHYFPI